GGRPRIKRLDQPLTRREKKRRGAAKDVYAEYRRAVEEAGKPKLAADIDVYLGPPGDEPLVVFHHIQKTAGTALRLLLHANATAAGLEHVVRFIPRDADRLAWWRELYGSSWPEGRQPAAIAGHHAAYLLEAVRDRPV